jgi:hypothetical protein
MTKKTAHTPGFVSLYLFIAIALLSSSAGSGNCSSLPAAGAFIIVTSTSGETGGPDCKLRDAITAANTGRATGGCTISGRGPVTVQLAPLAVYTLTVLDNTDGGGNGLPVVTGDITVEGNFATIRCAPELPGLTLRMFRVATGGRLMLRHLILRDGWATKAEDGGAIYSSGTVEIENSAFFQNWAGCGGAIFSTEMGALSVKASTFAENQGPS